MALIQEEALKNFLTLGKFLKYISSSPSIQLEENGRIVQENMKKAFLNSLKVSTEQQSNLVTKAENSKDIFRKRLKENQKSPFSVLQDQALTCYTYLPETSVGDFLQSRRTFWKSLFFQPDSMLTFTEKNSYNILLSGNQASPLEAITLLDPTAWSESLPDGKGLLIESKASFDTSSVAAVLTNSVRERTVLKTLRLALPHILTPYNVSFAIDLPTSTKKADQTSLDTIDLTRYLQLLLLRQDIRVLPQKTFKDTSKVFASSDLLGIPFVVVVSVTSLKDGVVLIRDRETTLASQMHSAHLVEAMTNFFYNRN